MELDRIRGSSDMYLRIRSMGIPNSTCFEVLFLARRYLLPLVTSSVSFLRCGIANETSSTKNWMGASPLTSTGACAVTCGSPFCILRFFAAGPSMGGGTSGREVVFAVLASREEVYRARSSKRGACCGVAPISLNRAQVGQCVFNKIMRLFQQGMGVPPTGHAPIAS